MPAKLIQRLTLGVVFSALLSCSHIYKVSLEKGEILTEDVAIRASKEALRMDGVDISQLEPAPYRTGSEEVFAKNTAGTGNGYILWRRRKTNDVLYSVSLERSGQQVICEIDKAK